VGIAENNEAMRRILDEVITGKHLELADELYADGHELHPDAGIARGPEGMKQAFAGLHDEFPDVRAEIEDIVAEGDAVAVRVTFTGTHAQAGDQATWPEMVLTRFVDGKAVASWEVTDTGRSPDAPAW
jgi:predicted SnoaL-like aldol condensation-catalyzing enzyme